MICLGIEGTAHTFGIGIVEDEKILANVKDTYVPKIGSGIHPIEAAEHHEKVKDTVLKNALNESNISLEDIDIVAFSQGPGLPPCLKRTLEFAVSLKKPLIGVNHCIAHIEMAKLFSRVKDPIVLFVSGGNTQVIGFASGRYRVFGETQDIAIGNAVDTFIRAAGLAHPGGPIMEALAKKGRYVELPYVVKGMDVSFSGILTAAIQKLKKEKLEDICFSFQETCYAMLVEIVERALAHAGKEEVLLTGGVSASLRLQEMLNIMCSEREAKFFVCPKEYSGDNGAMIAWTGLLAYVNGQDPLERPDFLQKWRADEVDIGWIRE